MQKNNRTGVAISRVANLYTAISHNYDEQQRIRMELQLAPFYAKVPLSVYHSIFYNLCLSGLVTENPT